MHHAPGRVELGAVGPCSTPLPCPGTSQLYSLPTCEAVCESCLCIFFFLFFSLHQRICLARGGKWGEKRESERASLFGCHLYEPQPRTQTHNPSMFPDQGSNPNSLVYRKMFQPSHPARAAFDSSTFFLTWTLFAPQSDNGPQPKAHP